MARSRKQRYNKAVSLASLSRVHTWILREQPGRHVKVPRRRTLYLSPKHHRSAMWCDAVVIAGSYWSACCTIVGSCMPCPSARMQASRIIMRVDYSVGCGWLHNAFVPFRYGYAVTAGLLYYRQSSVVILPLNMTKKICRPMYFLLAQVWSWVRSLSVSDGCLYQIVQLRSDSRPCEDILNILCYTCLMHTSEYVKTTWLPHIYGSWSRTMVPSLEWSSTRLLSRLCTVTLENTVQWLYQPSCCATTNLPPQTWCHYPTAHYHLTYDIETVRSIVLQRLGYKAAVHRSNHEFTALL